MKKILLPFLLLIGLSVYSQPFYIQSISFNEENFNSEQQERFDKIVAMNFYDTLKFASMEPLDVVNTSGQLPVNVSGLECPNPNYTIKYIKYEDENNYTLYGDIFEMDTTVLCQMGEIMITCVDGEIRGNITLEHHSFTLFDLTAGVYVLASSSSNTFLCGDEHPATQNGLFGSGPSPMQNSATNVCGACYIDVLVVFTPLALQYDSNPHLTAHHMINQVNTTHRNSSNSNPDIIYQLAGVDNITLLTSQFQTYEQFALALKNDDTTINLRNSYNADIAFCVTGGLFGSAAGSAWRWSDPPSIAGPDWGFAWANLGYIQSLAAFTHEMGHTLGAGHQKGPWPLNDAPDYNDFPFQKTWGSGIFTRKKSVATVMWAGKVPELGNLILHYSNPTVYYKGFYTGSAGKNENEIVMQSFACEVANYRTIPGSIHIDILGSNKGCWQSSEYLQVCLYNINANSATYTWETSINGINYTAVSGGAGANIYIYQQPGSIQHIRLKVQSGTQTYYAYHSIQVVVQGYNGLACTKSSAAHPTPVSLLEIAPNPTDQSITLTGVAQGAKYVIYNSLGQNVLHGELNSAFEIDLKNFASGTYFLHIEGTVKKIIKN